jgi:hypothetical protein
MESYAHAMQGRSQHKRVYDGVQRLVNGDPPLVHKFSNPVKVRLTPEGEELASRLHAIAVTMGEVESLPGLRTAAADAAPDVSLRKPPAAAAVRSASAASPSTAVQARACASPTICATPESNDEPRRKLQRLETASAVPSQPVLANELESSCIVVDTPPDGGVEATSPSSSPAHEAQETQNTKKRRRAPMEPEGFPDVSKGAACFAVLRFLVTKCVIRQI